MAARLAEIGSGNFGHIRSLAAQAPDHKFARSGFLLLRLALAALMAQ
jgi:hypothetical protein